MLIRHSYDSRFIALLDRLQKEYGSEMMKLSGIGEEDLDLNCFSKRFFKSKAATADKTIDANANVSDKSVLSWETELSKPLKKVNALYMLWKDAISKFSITRANRMIEAEIRGTIRVHDAHLWNKNYSYYQETPIIIRINQGNPLTVTMKHLFDMYSEFVVITYDMESIDLTNVYKEIYYKDRIPLSTLDSKRDTNEKNDRVFYGVKEKHYIEVLDTQSQWVQLKCVLRHKNTEKMIMYQTKSGNFSFVTANHPVILDDNNTVMAGNLTFDNQIKEEKCLIPYNEYIDVPENIAYFIGFVLGDGNIGRHSFYRANNSLSNSDISIAMAEVKNDISIYQKNIWETKIGNILKTEFGFGLKNRKVTYSDRAFFHSRLFKMLLSKYFGLSYNNSSYTNHLPCNILNWKNESKFAFIAGLVDSEGTITNNNSVWIRVTSFSIISQLADMLSTLNISFIKSVCGNNFEKMLGISFHPVKELIKHSVKLQNKGVIEKLVWDTDGNIRNNKVAKITEIKNFQFNNSQNKLTNLIEYVYDITTDSGTFYSNGMIQHNCYASSLDRLVEEGMPFYDKADIGPVKHFMSYINLSLQYLCYMSNQVAGASGFPSFFINMEYFVRKDYGDNWYEKPEILETINQHFQSWIYSVNFSWRSNQSPFTNISIFDKYWLNALFDMNVQPDGSKVNFDNVNRLQIMFLKEMIRNQEKRPMTFPVLTICMLTDKETGKFMDMDFVRTVAPLAVKTKTAHFYNDSNTANLSSCCRLRSNVEEANKQFSNSLGAGGLDVGCYDDKTEVLTDTGWKLFKDLVKGIDKICTLNKETNELEYHLPTDYIESSYSGVMHSYKHNNLDMLVTPNHNMLINDRYNNEYSLIQSAQLTSRHNIMRKGFILNRQNLDTIKIGDSVFKANPFFKLIGMYLGDGATYHDENEAKHRGYEIAFQLKSQRKIDSLVEVLDHLQIKYSFSFIKTRESWSYRFYSKDIWNFIKPCGKTLNKCTPRLLLQSGGFDNLSSLLDGLICTDGYKNGNIIKFYTSSVLLKNDFEELVTLLGKSFHSYKPRVRKSVLLKKDNRFIDSKNLQYVISILNNDKITRLKNYQNEVQYTGMIYCVTVPNNTMFVKRNGTAMVCGNSHRVVTINLPQIAYEVDNWLEFFRKLESRVVLAQDILDIHRQTIQKHIKSGHLPLFTYKYMRLEKQFSTIGFIGLNECLEIMGLDILTPEGTEKGKEIINTINSLNTKRSLADGNIRNVEQIPGESAAVTFAKKDSILFENANQYKLYSNQFIPLTKKTDIINRIKIQGEFDSMVGGGSVLFLNLENELTDDQLIKLMECCSKNKVIYYSVNYNYAQCPACKKIYIGKFEESPCCKEPMKNYIKIVGFLTEVNNWIKERREDEYPERQFYTFDDFETEEKN